MMRQCKHLLVGLLLVSTTQAQTSSPDTSTVKEGDAVILVLKDGTFVGCEIVVKTSKTIRVKSIYGIRSYNLRDIDRIVEDVDYSDAGSVERFEQLPDALKAALNARADYDLGNYERAFSRLDPFLEYDENQSTRNLIDWLLIEIYERQGRWDDAKRMLKAKKKRGSPREKLRAEAHLDIFKRNPDYDLRYIGTKHARNFLVIADQYLRNKAREPNSLTEREIMHAGLAEYCEQLLQAEGFSVPALESYMDLKKTYEAVRELSPSGDLERHLPYATMLERAEESISKAQVVLAGYGDIYELQLVRVEVAHFTDVWYSLSRQMVEASPRRITPAYNAQTGKLTRDGRKQLMDQCDEFVKRGRLIVWLIEYMKTKLERYPRKLDSLIELHNIALEYHENMIRWAKRLRNKTRV